MAADSKRGNAFPSRFPVILPFPLISISGFVGFSVPDAEISPILV